MHISNFTGNCLKSVKQSAVSDKLLEYNCAIEFDHFDILAFTKKIDTSYQAKCID